jgi:hypothetical protein
MNEKNPTPPAASSIEDNYPEYIDDEFGYAYEIADRMTQREIARHDELLHADAAALDALDKNELEKNELGELNDLELWATARARRRLGDEARYFAICEALLASDDEHPLIIYPEISRRVAFQRALAGDLDPARARLAAHLERWPDDLQAEQLAAVLDFLASSDDDAMRRLVERFPRDAEIRFEIAEDLWRLARPDAAFAWLDEARRVATLHDRATLVDVELLAARMSEIP